MPLVLHPQQIILCMAFAARGRAVLNGTQPVFSHLTHPQRLGLGNICLAPYISRLVCRSTYPAWCVVLHIPLGVSFYISRLVCRSTYPAWCVVLHIPLGVSFYISRLVCRSTYPAWCVVLHIPLGAFVGGSYSKVRDD